MREWIETLSVVGVALMMWTALAVGVVIAADTIRDIVRKWKK